MITFRREYLDTHLFRSTSHMRGDVLDVGGRKNKKRGRFRPPTENVSSWKYVNPDPSSQPDFLSTAEALPVANSSIDTVVMTEVIEYLPDPNLALREIYRVLKPGGVAIISVPLLSPVHGDWQFDLSRYTRSGLEKILEKSGFGKMEISEMGGLGAVCFDLFEAAWGYGNPKPGICSRIARKLLFLSVPIFRLLDRPSTFVTTGYFVVARRQAE